MLSNSRDVKGNVNDGFFEIKYLYDGVYLTVYPAVAKGRKVDVDDVVDRLTKKRVSGFDRGAIESAVNKADKSPVKIAAAQEELKTNATATIMISADKMKANLTLYPPEGGRMLTLEEIKELLAKQGVVHGINESTLDTISKYPVYNEIICLAEGDLPVNGQNGTIKFEFDINKERKPTVLEDGRVDFRELNLIDCVSAGQVLCSLVPPTTGTPGKSVTGMEIRPVDGKPAILPKGKNVDICEDGQQLVASIDGQVNYIDGKVNVFANYEVSGDVDNSTGNINFIGNVLVRGNVLSGFTVEAGGNVEVIGVVEGAVIKAGGDIILKRGMQGLGKGILISGGDIIARYIEHSNIEAKNDIKAEAIMHSNIKCGNKLELAGKKGLLVGGTCKVGNEVVSKVIGSHMATVTEIEVGIDPTLRERYKIIKEEIISNENDIKKAEQAITILKKLEMAGALTPEKQEMMVKSVRTKVFLGNKINELKNEMATIEAKLQQDVNGKVRASSFIYPGTKVSIGTCMMYVKDNLQYCCLYRDGADIRMSSFNK
ncbi:MAG: FapA family protein [Clostridia bacterium]|nr:FapA family protein [Clostridia bacterium]